MSDPREISRIILTIEFVCSFNYFFLVSTIEMFTKKITNTQKNNMGNIIYKIPSLFNIRLIIENTLL